MISRVARIRAPTRDDTGATGGRTRDDDGMSTTEPSTLTYDVFVNDPPPQDGILPNGEPKLFSPMASTLISGSEDAVLTDPGMTIDQARALGDWVASKGPNLTDIFVTHGHGDHWFAAELLAERFGARVVASAGTIAQMERNAAARPLLWDKVYTGIPPTPVTAVTVPDNRFTLEGHELVIVEVGNTDSEDTTVLHVPDLEVVVAGDVIYNGVHMYLAQPAIEARLRTMARGDRQGRVAQAPPHRRRAPEQGARRRRRADDRRDPAVPRRRAGAPADGEDGRRLLQREARALPEPPGPVRAVGRCPDALRRAGAPRGGSPEDQRRVLALGRVEARAAARAAAPSGPRAWPLSPDSGSAGHRPA